MAEKKKKTPTRKRKVTPPHKKWRWRVAKFLLVLACFALVGAIYLIQFLEDEAGRLGVFPTERVQAVDPAEKTVAREAPPPPVSEDITSDDKQQLDAILQSRSE